jgi:hypothetical protein
MLWTWYLQSPVLLLPTSPILLLPIVDACWYWFYTLVLVVNTIIFPACRWDLSICSYGAYIYWYFVIFIDDGDARCLAGKTPCKISVTSVLKDRGYCFNQCSSQTGKRLIRCILFSCIPFYWFWVLVACQIRNYCWCKNSHRLLFPVAFRKLQVQHFYFLLG